MATRHAQENAMRGTGRFAALIATGVTFGCVSPQPIPTASGLKPVVVKGSFSTTASNAGKDGINFDVVGGDALPFGKVKRYTVTIHTALLSTAPVGVDAVEVMVGVLKGASSLSVRVLRQDPATASPLPHPGFTIPPYTGTGSYIRVVRGADGLGPMEVSFNAYVEVEP
jgi:hypothetical protein